MFGKRVRELVGRSNSGGFYRSGRTTEAPTDVGVSPADDGRLGGSYSLVKCAGGLLGRI